MSISSIKANFKNAVDKESFKNFNIAVMALIKSESQNLAAPVPGTDNLNVFVNSTENVWNFLDGLFTHYTTKDNKKAAEAVQQIMKDLSLVMDADTSDLAVIPPEPRHP